MFHKVLLGLTSLICLALLIETASAGSRETRKDRTERSERKGLAERLHTVKRYGKRVCMTEHMHYGLSEWNPSKKLSYDEAVNSWSVFTKFEYGDRWSNFKRSRKRKVNCIKNSRGLWRCDAESHPCRQR